MDEEVRSRLLRYADQLESAASKGAGFVAEHSPETVRQFLAWHFWSSVIGAAMCAVVAITMLAVSRWALRKSFKDGEERLFPLGLLSGLLSPVPLAGLVGYIATVMKVALAPNVFILEKLAEVVK